MSKNKSIKESAPANPAQDVTAFTRGIFSDLAPLAGESTTGSNITSAVLTDYERAAAERIAAMLGERGSLSIVLKVALRRLIVEGLNAGVFADVENA